MSKRKAIKRKEYLAAALACLLPQDQRDALRAARVPAEAVLRLFTPDHIVLHCFETPRRDEWHNLTPALRPAHAEKSRRDTKIAAKVKRLRGETCAGPKKKIPQRRNPWPPKGSRTFFNRAAE